MRVKLMLLNLRAEEAGTLPQDVEATEVVYGKEPALHDYHVIIMDSDELVNKDWYGGYSTQDIVNLTSSDASGISKGRFAEVVQTGGVVVCFAGPNQSMSFGPIYGTERRVYSYKWLPVEMGVVSDAGDTIRATETDPGPFAELLKLGSTGRPTWECYFSNLPRTARVYATNRAGYPVFIEASIGQGRVVLVPRFADRKTMLQALVQRVIPELFKGEELPKRPDWVKEFESGFESDLRSTLAEVETAKRLLYARESELKKAAAWAFKKLGFEVAVLADGTSPDLEIGLGEARAKVDVTGHYREQGGRPDVLGVLAHLSEGASGEKGVVVCDHQIDLLPSERSDTAFTPGAIELAEKNGVALISSIALWEVASMVLERRIDEGALAQARRAILESSGMVRLVGGQTGPSPVAP